MMGLMHGRPHRVMTATVAITALVLATLTACREHRATEPRREHRATEPHDVWRLGGDAGLLGRMTGRVHGDSATRCVWVGPRSAATQILWPQRYRLRFGPFRIEGPGGRVVARDGDWLRLGGGLGPSTAWLRACPSGDGHWRVWVPGWIQFWGSRRPRGGSSG
jgi:hypothetical protein